jgi:hypothetical protein
MLFHLKEDASFQDRDVTVTMRETAEMDDDLRDMKAALGLRPEGPATIFAPLPPAGFGCRPAHPILRHFELRNSPWPSLPTASI